MLIFLKNWRIFHSENFSCKSSLDCSLILSGTKTRFTNSLKENDQIPRVLSWKVNLDMHTNRLKRPPMVRHNILLTNWFTSFCFVPFFSLHPIDAVVFDLFLCKHKMLNAHQIRNKGSNCYYKMRTILHWWKSQWMAKLWQGNCLRFILQQPK